VSCGNPGAATAAAQTTAFDGAYSGIERRLMVEHETLKRERYGMHSSGCSPAFRPPPELAIKDGVATTTCCLGGCRLEGPLGANGHVSLRGSGQLMQVQLYPKGTNPRQRAVPDGSDVAAGPVAGLLIAQRYTRFVDRCPGE
jgi:hypothetical protein